MRILLVEDDPAMAAVVTEFLTKLHYVLDIANDGQEGWEFVEAYTYDLILLDVMLPKMDGMTLCRRIRSHGYRMPVLLLTARQTSTDKVMGLDVGADDYVVKPFDLKELGARIRALLRRGNSALSPVLQWGKLHLDPSTCEVTYDNKTIPLSPKEYSLLELFLRNSRRIFNRSAILDHLWSWENPPGEDTVKAHIKGLRQKFKSVGAPSDFIETVYGMGYRLKPLSNEEQEQNMPQIIAAGLADDVTSWLQQRLNLPIQIASNNERTLDELERGNWSLLLLDRSAISPTVTKVLEEAYARLKQEKQTIVYCLERSLGEKLPKKLVGYVLFHPLDREELANIAAEILGLSLEPLVKQPAEQYRERKKTIQSEIAQLPASDTFSASFSMPENQRATEIASLQSAVTGLWEKFKDKIIARLVALEQASAALLIGNLPEELRQEAIREAHKLAGSLGTFGFAEGSSIAREVEELLQIESLRTDNLDGKKLTDEVVDSRFSPAHYSIAVRLHNLVVELHQHLENASGEKIPVANSVARQPVLFANQQPRLLIVEEDIELAQRLVMEAAAWGIHADRVKDLVAAKNTIQNAHPDLVLLDLCFSDSFQDGLALLKELSRESLPVPAIVLTSRDSLTDRVEVARLGGCAFLRKPIQPTQIMEAVNQVLEQSRRKDLKVMAVDDDPQILTSLETLLQPWGLKLITINDSRMLWDTLEATAPDLLVLDVDMPHINGIELCQVIRNDPKWNSLPVLFLSGRRDADTIERVYGVGADDYLHKPIAGEELVTRIFNRLQRIQVLRSIAETDILTGIANRLKSTKDVERLLKLANRHRQQFCFAVLILDSVGEADLLEYKILQRFGKLLMHHFRAEDVVARWGLTEFVVGMYGITKEVAIERLTQLIPILHKEPVVRPLGEKSKWPIAFSAGVVQYPDDGADLLALYQNAHQALTRAKTSGGDRIGQYSSF
ncbi:MAG TPA: response regulator [Leptolyngbyaceae cyanobacterium]